MCICNIDFFFIRFSCVVSCWAFATVAALEGIAPYITDNKFMNLSAQQLIDCSKGYGTHGCAGGLPSEALAYVTAKGIVSENKYPYQAIDKTCDSSLESSPELGIHTFASVPPNDEKALANVVYDQPVIVVHSVNQAFQYYGGGIFRDANGTCENSNLSHVTTIVGYGTTRLGVEYWILKNSWGEDWGEKGYMRILRNPLNKSAGVCNLAIYPVYPSLDNY